MKASLTERLEARTVVGEPDFSDPLVRLAPGCASCKIFTGERNKGGYGRIRVDGVKLTTHRAFYEGEHGAVAPGVNIDHLCRNRACWEGSHLEPVSAAENTRRGISAVLSAECPSGHTFTDENTYLNGGNRYCKECRAAAHLRRKAKITPVFATEGASA